MDITDRSTFVAIADLLLTLFAGDDVQKVSKYSIEIGI